MPTGGRTTYSREFNAEMVAACLQSRPRCGFYALASG